jgi:hypothetical protein
MHSIEDFNPCIIYFAVGCSMKHYKDCDISSNNNQQNPSFLQKFKDSKIVYIFVDPELENPLKLESQITLNESYSSEDCYRILKNDNIIVFTINNPFYFYDKKDKISDIYTTFKINQSFITSLILYCTENKKKLIVQDYTGIDINNSYLDFYDFFPTIKLDKYIIFDITQNNGGCFIDFDNTTVYYDTDGNFIQPNLLTLSKLKELDNNIFKVILIKRINWINYYISRQIRIINKEIEDCLKNLAIIHGITTEFSIENLENTIMFVMLDIIEAFDLSTDILIHISNNNYNQKIICNTLSHIKSLI